MKTSNNRIESQELINDLLDWATANGKGSEHRNEVARSTLLGIRTSLNSLTAEPNPRADEILLGTTSDTRRNRAVLQPRR